MSEKTFHFTERGVADLPKPPLGQRVTYRDTKTEGLELRVSDRGTKSYSWYRRIKGGDPERVTIGRHPGVTVVKARDEATKHNQVRVSGASPVADQRAKKRAAMTFNELFDQYINRHAKLKKKTWAEDQQRYEQYLEKKLGRLRLSDITRVTIAALHAAITTDGHPVVANRVLALVSSVFGRGKEWSFVESNPAEGIRRNKELSRERYFGSEEMPRILRAVMAESNEVVRDFFLVALFTGARRANVLSMAWSDINLTDAVWHIPITKNGTSQDVPLLIQVTAILQQRKKADPDSKFVFRGSGELGHLVEPRKAWLRVFDRDELFHVVAVIEESGEVFKDLIDKSGKTKGESLEARLARAKQQAAASRLKCNVVRLSPARIHDLRRTMGSWQANSGVPLNIIGKSLNHKHLGTTASYARLQLDPVRDAMARVVGDMIKTTESKPPAG